MNCNIFGWDTCLFTSTTIRPNIPLIQKKCRRPWGLVSTFKFSRGWTLSNLDNLFFSFSLTTSAATHFHTLCKENPITVYLGQYSRALFVSNAYCVALSIFNIWATHLLKIDLHLRPRQWAAECRRRCADAERCSDLPALTAAGAERDAHVTTKTKRRTLSLSHIHCPSLCHKGTERIYPSDSKYRLIRPEHTRFARI